MPTTLSTFDKLSTENQYIKSTNNNSTKLINFSSFIWGVEPASKNIFDFKKYLKFTTMPLNLTNNKTTLPASLNTTNSFTLTNTNLLLNISSTSIKFENSSKFKNFTGFNNKHSTISNFSQPVLTTVNSLLPLQNTIEKSNSIFSTVKTEQNNFSVADVITPDSNVRINTTYIASIHATTSANAKVEDFTINSIQYNVLNKTEAEAKNTKIIKSTTDQTDRIVWPKGGVGLSKIQNITDFDYLNCTERNRQISARLAPNPICDCPINQLKDINGQCKKANLATIRARLIRLCGTRSHFDSLSSETHAAIIYSKVSCLIVIRLL